MKLTSVEDIVREFEKNYVRGHGPMANGHHDVQEAASWIEAEHEDITAWLRTTLVGLLEGIKSEIEGRKRDAGYTNYEDPMDIEIAHTALVHNQALATASAIITSKYQK